MNVIGIDPGAHGAMCLFSDGRLVDIRDMPTTVVSSGPIKKKVTKTGGIIGQQKTMTRLVPGAVTAILKDWVEIWGQCEVFLEEVGARPGQGVISMFSFGRSVGIVEESIAVAGLICNPVHPATWKRVMACNKDKNFSRKRAIQLVPEAAELFMRGKDDGRAEACLIGLYGYKLLRKDQTL